MSSSRFPLALALASLLLTACPGPSSPNPSTLWLDMNGSETAIKLVDHEPPPF